MFGMDMFGTYEQRKVGCYEDTKGKKLVSTVAVTDSTFPYETAIQHPEYNNGALVIVENYETKGDAEIGHKRWVGIMKSDELPDPLMDTGQSKVSQMCDLGGEAWRKYPRKKN